MLGPLGGLSSNLFKPINEIIKQCEIDQNTQKVNWQKIHAFFNWTMERKKKEKKHANIRGKLLFSSKQTYKHYTYNDNDRERWAGKRIINVSCLVEETALIKGAIGLWGILQLCPPRDRITFMPTAWLSSMGCLCHKKGRVYLLFFPFFLTFAPFHLPHYYSNCNICMFVCLRKRSASKIYIVELKKRKLKDVRFNLLSVLTGFFFLQNVRSQPFQIFFKQTKQSGNFISHGQWTLSLTALSLFFFFFFWWTYLSFIHGNVQFYGKKSISNSTIIVSNDSLHVLYLSATWIKLQLNCLWVCVCFFVKKIQILHWIKKNPTRITKAL